MEEKDSEKKWIKENWKFDNFWNSKHKVDRETRTENKQIKINAYNKGYVQHISKNQNQILI